jgi:hypothetical protein
VLGSKGCKTLRDNGKGVGAGDNSIKDVGSRRGGDGTDGDVGSFVRESNSSTYNYGPGLVLHRASDPRGGLSVGRHRVKMQQQETKSSDPSFFHDYAPWKQRKIASRQIIKKCDSKPPHSCYWPQADKLAATAGASKDTRARAAPGITKFHSREIFKSHENCYAVIYRCNIGLSSELSTGLANLIRSRARSSRCAISAAFR